MIKFFASVLVIGSALLIATPSYATKGIDAARICEKTPRCHVEYYDDGSIIIINDSGTISCPGPQQDCTVIGIRPGMQVNPKANKLGAPAKLAP
jgi:hypothetical protein